MGAIVAHVDSFVLPPFPSFCLFALVSSQTESRNDNMRPHNDHLRGDSPAGEVYMSLDVLNQVWAADMAFLRDMYLLDADFFRFVWGLLQQPEAMQPATVAFAAHAGTKVRKD